MIVLVMFVTTAISGWIIYHNIGGAAADIGISPPTDGGQLPLPNSTSMTFAVADGEHVTVANTSLPAEDFTAAGTNSNFTCAASPSGAYLTLTNNGTGSASVASFSIDWGGVVTAFALSGPCNIAASALEPAVVYLMFPPASQASPSAVSGQPFTGDVTLSDGTPVFFQGIWQ